MSKLKPCPFCGSYETHILVTDGELYQPGCWGCGASGLTRNSREEATAEWNRRAPDPKLARLEKWLEEQEAKANDDDFPTKAVIDWAVRNVRKAMEGGE